MTIQSANPPPFIRPLRAGADFAMRRSAIIALALFAIVGFAVLDDYGVSTDEGQQRNIGLAALGRFLGDEDAPSAEVNERHNRFYGVAFEVFLAAARIFSALGRTIASSFAWTGTGTSRAATRAMGALSAPNAVS